MFAPGQGSKHFLQLFLSYSLFRNVTFHLLLFLYFAFNDCCLHKDGFLNAPPPVVTPQPQRSRRLQGSVSTSVVSRARKEWSGALPLPPSGGPSPLTGRIPRQSICTPVACTVKRLKSNSNICVFMVYLGCL